MRGRRAAGVWVAVIALSGCSAVGYPSPLVPAAPERAPDRGGSFGGDAPDAARDPSPEDVRPEPLSRYGNPPTYEVFGEEYETLPTADEGWEEVGLASWYGDEFAGRPTSSGEIFDPDLLTAAHRSLPLPTWAEVVNLENGRRVLVRINDRGPFHDTDRRIIDLSEAAARRLGMIGQGTARVRIRVLAGPVAPGPGR